MSSDDIAPPKGIPARVGADVTGDDTVMVGIEIKSGSRAIVTGNTIWLPIDRHLAEDLGLVRRVKILLVPQPTEA